MYRNTRLSLFAMVLLGSAAVALTPTPSYSQDTKSSTGDVDGGELKPDKATKPVEVKPAKVVDGRFVKNPKEFKKEAERRKQLRIKRRQEKIKLVRYNAEKEG